MLGNRSCWMKPFSEMNLHKLGSKQRHFYDFTCHRRVNLQVASVRENEEAFDATALEALMNEVSACAAHSQKNSILVYGFTLSLSTASLFRHHSARPRCGTNLYQEKNHSKTTRLLHPQSRWPALPFHSPLNFFQEHHLTSCASLFYPK